MIPLLACLGFLVGWGAGALANVVADRVPSGRRVWGAGPSCPACGRVAEGGPGGRVASWLRWGGRCRDCGARRRLRYLLVEAVVAAIFTGLVFLLGASWLLPGYWWAAAVAAALTLTDLDHRRIPDRILLPGVLGALLLLFLGSLIEGDLWAVARGLGGAGIYFGLLLVIALAARGGFGFGDVKLGLLLGLLLAHRSWGTLVVGVVAGFALGGLAAVALLAARRVHRRDFIPFGPGMVAGAGIALGWGEALARWYLG